MSQFYNDEGKEQYTFLAIFSGGLDMEDDALGTYYRSQNLQCTMAATKITAEILDWMKAKAGIQ